MNITAAPLPESSKFELEVSRRLERLGWRILHHNVSVFNVQVDLLARSTTGVLTLVEVKSPSPLMRLSRGQRLRLFRAAAALSALEPVELVLSTVWRGRVLVIPVDGLTE